MAELETERITFTLQEQKAAKLARGGEEHPSDMGSVPPSVTDDDGRSNISSMQSESGVHVSQTSLPPTSVSEAGPQDGGLQAQKLRKSKLQLWNDLKISGKSAFSYRYTAALTHLQQSLERLLLSTH